MVIELFVILFVPILLWLIFGWVKQTFLLMDKNKQWVLWFITIYLFQTNIDWYINFFFNCFLLKTVINVNFIKYFHFKNNKN